MASELDPTVGRGQLRTALRRAREKLGLTQAEVAKQMGWSLSKINRMEQGRVAVSQSDLRSLVVLYEIDNSVASQMLDVARRSRHQTWSQYRDVFPADFVSYLGYEDAAARRFEFQPVWVPGSLQTRAYARALIESVATGVDGQSLARRIDARLAHQVSWSEESLRRAAFIVSETALRSWVGCPGDPIVMREQMEHLIKVASRNGVEIRVLPLAFGTHLGLAGGFSILEFGGDHEDVLYRELARPALIVGERAKIRDYKELFDRLWDGSRGVSDVAKEVLNSLPPRLVNGD